MIHPHQPSIWQRVIHFCHSHHGHIDLLCAAVILCLLSVVIVAITQPSTICSSHYLDRQELFSLFFYR